MEFEKIYKEFELIIKKLENGGLGLDESIKLFEQGVNLLKQCYGALGESKGKITVLSEELAQMVEKPLDITEDKNA